MELLAKIRSLFDSTGTDQAAEGAKKVTEGLKETEKGAKSLTEVWQDLKKELLEFVTVAAVVEQLKDGVTEALNMEKALRGIDIASAAAGREVHEARQQVEEFSEALARLAGVSRTEVAEALSKQYMATGDLGQAMSRVKLATDIATATGKTFSEGEAVVEQAVRGRTRALEQALGVRIAGTTADEKAANAIQFLIKTYSGATEKIQDNAKTLDQASVRWDLFKEKIGTALTPAIAALSKAMSNVVSYIEEAGQVAGTVFVAIGNDLGTLTAIVRAALTGNLADARALYSRLKGEALSDLSDLAKIHDKFSRERETRDDEYAKRVAELANQQVVANKKIGDESAKTQAHVTDLTLAELRSQLALAQTLWEKYYHGIKVINAEQAKDIEKLFDEGSATEARLDQVRRIYANKRLELARTIDKELVALRVKELKDDQDAADYDLEIARKKALQIAKITIAMYKLNQKERERDLKEEQKAADSIIGLAEGVFGQHKALGIAKAIIDTYVGANEVWADPTLTYYQKIVATVAEIASGLANVATISGVGFDDPVNDRGAILVGRKWAADFMTLATAGFHDGLRGGVLGASTNVTHNNAATYNVTVNAGAGVFSGDRQALLNLGRNLEQVMQKIDRKRVIASRNLG
jgi:hypothetical protein